MSNPLRLNILLILPIVFFIFPVFKTDLIVRSPPELANQFINNTIKTGLSNFGKIPYGYSIEGRLLYDPNNTDNQIGCKKYNIFAQDNPNVGDSPFILVKRGECTFTQKVKNIEDAGGHVAIIVNDNDLKAEDMFMADDGHGKDIAIPAVIISKVDGDKLIQYYIQHKTSKSDIANIRFEIKFDVEKKDYVTYDIWYTPDLESIYIFLNEFKKYQIQLRFYAKLHIHFVTYVDYAYNEEFNQPVKNCFGSGKYCVRPNYKLKIEDNTDILLEMLKQKCVYNFAYEEVGSLRSEVFWIYMANFYEKCIQTNNFNPVCSNNIIDDLGILKYVNKCIKDSFIGTESQKKEQNYMHILKNSILDKEFELKKKHSINRVPALSINDRLHNGAVRPEYIFQSICASFTVKPQVCISEGALAVYDEGYSFTSVFFIILVVVSINVVIFILCQKFIKKKIKERIDSTNINSRIDSVVNSYLALREQENK